MISTILQMAVIISCGAIWRKLSPRGLNATETRLVITSLVYYVLLPALVLEVLWRAEIGIKSLQYTFLGVSCVAITLMVSWMCGKLLRLSSGQMGAFLLAAAFPNVTFLGLPVLEQLFGDWARSVVIQIDLFAIAPFLFTVGIAIARHYGQDTAIEREPVWTFLNTPPFWAMFVAVALNLNHVAAPEWLFSVLQRLAVAVIPLMLFSMGLALSWQAVSIKRLPLAFVVILLKLLAMPLLALILVRYLDLAATYKIAAVMDIAMPSMLMGVVLCDRYQLDSALYAMLVTLTTLVSMVSLPLWHPLLITQLPG